MGTSGGTIWGGEGKGTALGPGKGTGGGVGFVLPLVSSDAAERPRARRSQPLFADNFDEDAVGEFAFEQVDNAAFYVAFEDLALGFGGSGMSWSYCKFVEALPR